MKYFNEPSKEYISALNKSLDYDEHNEMVKKTFEDFNIGKTSRMPMHIGINSRFLMLNPQFNKLGITYKQFTYDARIMFEMMTEFVYFTNMYVPYFHKMGSTAPLFAYPDFQNYSESMWFGANVLFKDNEVPNPMQLIYEDNKNLLFDKGIPEPFSGIYKHGFECYEKFIDYAKNYDINGCTVDEIWPAGLTTDGPFTIACELLGTTNVCAYIYEDPDYIEKILDYLTTSIIVRIKAFRKYCSMPERMTSMFMADDSIALLSCDMYKDLILPYHKRLVKELITDDGTLKIHLCGDATRHFKTIHDELRCREFDTGFPVKHAELCRVLGSDTVIMGGPSVAFLEYNDIPAIKKETRRIIEEVKPCSKSFILREGNNIPPKMDLNKVLAMYETVVEYGKY